MQKVLFVITKSNWGGAQKYVYTLATALPREEFQVSVALGGTGAPGSAPGRLAEMLRAAHLEVRTVTSFARDISLMSDVKTFFELLALFRDERPDVVHLNSSKAGGVGALAARFAGVRRIIFTSHGLPWDEDRGAFAKAAIHALSWLTFVLCHKVIVLSQDNFARASTLLFCGSKVVLVHNGVASVEMEERERARISLATRLGYIQASSGLWIGTIAELTRNKGLTYLLEAAAELKKQDRLFDVFILGGGEDEAQLRARALELKVHDVVHLMGHTHDAARYLPAFDLFVLPSVKEGLPYVLLEAGQAGLPVIVSDLPGCHDIVEDGKTGLMFISKDAHELATKITRLADMPDERTRLGEALKEKVTKEFSLEQMLEKTKQLYR
jgi:glycosyltransferase involved in cell wall biosynthesis